MGAPEELYELPRTAFVANFLGQSNLFEVEVPGSGQVQVFAQNVEAGPAAHLGDEVWLSWLTEHTFGLADDRLETGALTADFSTQAIAAQAALESE